MPEYKNAPAMSDDTVVWRYLSLSGVIATIKDQQLRLTRVDKFKDPFEGSVPRETMNQQLLIFSGNAAAQRQKNSPALDEEPWTRMTRLRRALTRSGHASCWSAGDESEALWRLYCDDDGCQGVGIALQTTLARLKASVPTDDFYVSPITYRPYHTGPAFTDEMDHLLNKRQGFAAEKEVRVLRFDQAHYKTLIPKDAPVTDLDEYMYVDWAFGDVIDKIVVGPYADKNYENKVRDAVTAVDPSLADCVVLSDLHERKYAPNY